jgi:hypothetical protein
MQDRRENATARMAEAVSMRESEEILMEAPEMSEYKPMLYAFAA